MPFLSVIGAAAAAEMGQVSARMTTTAQCCRIAMWVETVKYLKRQTAPLHHEVIELVALYVHK